MSHPKFATGREALAAEIREVTPATPIRKRLTVLTDEEMERRPKPAQVIEGVLLERSTSGIVGPPGVGKGLILMDLLYRVALGLDYYGHATAAGTCVYIAMERQGGLGARIRAWKEHHHFSSAAPVLFIPERFSLFDRGGAARLLDELCDESLFPPPIRVVGIDTFAKAMLPGNENETRDMGLLMANLQEVAETGPNVLAIHHLNASGTRERGNTSFLGDIDTKILVERDNGGVRLRCDKQNELAPFADITLSIIPAGESAVVTTSNGGLDLMLRLEHIECLRALDNAALGDEASSSAWKGAYGKPDSTFYNHVGYLVRKSYVVKGDGRRGRFSLTLAGKSAIAPTSNKTPINLQMEVDCEYLQTSRGLIKGPGVGGSQLEVEEDGAFDETQMTAFDEEAD